VCFAQILRVSPDLLAIEECDRFADFFLPALRKVGYDGCFAPKKDSPSTAFGYYSDGVAILWKTSVLRPVCAATAAEAAPGSMESAAAADERKESRVEVPPFTQQGLASSVSFMALEQSPSAHVVVALEHLETSKRFVAAATHLKAKKGIANEQKRAHQIRAVLDRIEEVASNAAIASSLASESAVESAWGGLPVVLMGDFNADAFPDPRERQDAEVEVEEAEACPQSFAGEEFGLAVGEAVAWKGGALKSAYPLAKAEEETEDAPEVAYTTWKCRSGKETRHTIDYMFFDKAGFEVRRVLGPASDLPPSRLPCAAYPSDHLAIAADVLLK